MRILLTAAAIISGSAQAGEPFPADSAKVEYGAVRFRLMHHEREAGEMYYSMTRDGDAIIIHDGTTLLPATRESGSAVIDAVTFAPRSIVIDGDFERTIFDADLKFENGKASGVYFLKRPDEVAKASKPFEAEVADGVILRTSFFGLVTGLPLADNTTFEFNWFSELGRATQPVELAVEGRETVTTPAGEFETFVAHLKATPENIVYVTVAEPRKVVRIDVVGQEMRFERLPDTEE